MAERGDTPQNIGRYELLTKFATGGMAELFLARERGLGGMERVVVIKRLLPHLADDPNSRDMFLREARLIARLNHPNVVQIYDLGEEDGDFFLVMEYLHGSTLRELTDLVDEELDAFPLDIAVSLFEQACKGLHAAHELKDLEGNPVELIHRDVSPQNLMLTTEGWVKLLDFGVAKAAEGDEATYSGAIKGKFSYMSPEQLHRAPLDRRSDIFALGVVMWEVFAGARLFKRGGELETMTAITEEEPPPPRSRNPAIPTELNDLVLRALRKDREARFSTVEDLRQELVAVAERHDLLTDQKTLAGFLDTVAGDRLEERDETLHHALEHSLTVGERARLRHEGTRAGLDARPEAERTATARPGSQTFQEITADSGDPTVMERPSSLRDEASPAATTRQESGTDPGESDDGTSTDPLFRWQVGLTSAAFVLLAAAAVFAYLQPSADGAGEREGEAAEAEPVPDGEPLALGWAPIATPEVLREEAEPIRLYLQRTLDRPVTLTIPDSYETTSEQLRTGQLEVAALPPLLFVLTERANPNVRALATREFDGATEGNGLLLVSSDSEYRELEDLRGKTFCFPDRNSTTGHFLPRVYIRRHVDQAQTFIGEIHWSGNHLQVLRDLMAGRCDASATYNGSFLTADQYGIPVGRFRTIAVTGYIPHGTVIASPALSDEEAEAVQSALLKFAPTEHVDGQPSKIGTTLKLTGFSRADQEAYDELRRAVRSHQDLLQFVGLESNAPADRLEGEAEGREDAGGRGAEPRNRDGGSEDSDSK